MGWLRLPGVALLVLLAVDAFTTVLLPSARGGLSMLWVRLLWAPAARLPGRVGSAARRTAAPLSVAATIATWIVLLWLGFALLYLPQVDELALTSQAQGGGGGLPLALYFSGTTLTTVGLGDVAAVSDGLRLLVVLQGACGLAVFTAALGYLPALYTVVSQVRTAVEAVSDLQVTTAERAAELLAESPELLDSVRGDVVAVRQHLLRFPVLHWFHPPARESVLALVEGATLLWLAAGGFADDHHAPLRRRAAALQLALRRLVEDARTQVGGVVRDEDTDDLVEQARQAVQRSHPGGGEVPEPTPDVLEVLTESRALMRAYARRHGYPVPEIAR